jgi:hypothetical protein
LAHAFSLVYCSITGTGSGAPARAELRLLRSALDQLEPGRDPAHGRTWQTGRVARDRSTPARIKPARRIVVLPDNL